MTGRDLMQRLRADPALRARRRLPPGLDPGVESAETVPLGAWPVLEATAELMAAAPEPGVLREDPGHGTTGFAFARIAKHLRRFGFAGEHEALCHLILLVAAGLLLVREDGALAWPVSVSNGRDEAGASERLHRLFGGDA